MYGLIQVIGIAIEMKKPSYLASVLKADTNYICPVGLGGVMFNMHLKAENCYLMRVYVARI